MTTALYRGSCLSLSRTVASKNFAFHRCGRTAPLAVVASSICSAQSLRQEADSAGVSIGTAVRPAQFSEAAYASTLARGFSMVEPEDAMKWLALRPDAETYDFRQVTRWFALLKFME